MDLAEELLNINSHPTGIIMSNRCGLPEDIRRKRLRLPLPDTVTYMKDEKIMLLMWKDKRNVHVLSTFHAAETQLVQRIKRTGQIEEIQKPIAIIDYTKNMGAVDRADHYIAS
ncbi:hypothetical protein JTB14_012810 [Gonioctena quinquepunctata]|nr:hypothetical protein JTB14_012810 [Gonioctena quinquepunctata]